MRGSLSLTVGDLSATALRQRLRRGSLVLRTGPFTVRIQTRLESVAAGIKALYRDFELDAGEFCDFHVRVDRVGTLRRWLRPQVNFWFDGHAPFKPLPLDHAFALLEWGLNWCVAGRAHHYLMLHAASLERGGYALILPGDPGAGKSTLTAALMLAGWRLLSDELTLVDRTTGRLVALSRPVSLKNASIDVIQSAFPDAYIGVAARDTNKGTVAHLRPTCESTVRVGETAAPRWIVFPRWREGAEVRITPHSRADAFLHTASHAFNYSLLGALGFELNAALMDSCTTLDFEYSKLNEAIAAFEEIAA